ncbi:MAG: rod shape-determining protein [Clostridia bacterium]|nr:rod shape-determining protein [Clostridia bacterium]
MKSKLAIDLGSSFVKIYKAGADVVLYEPTLIAIENGNYRKPLAVGYDAQKLVGKTPENVEIIRPIINAEIVNEKALASLVSAFIKKVKASSVEFNPEVLISVQCGSEREVIKQYEKVLNGANIFNINYAEVPVLSLIGSEAPLTDSSSIAVIDFGGEQTTVCALTLSGVISGVSMAYGGNKLNEMIIKHIESEFNLSISNSQAEKLKIEIASLVSEDDTKAVISGRDVLSGKTRSMQILASDIALPVKKFIDKIIEITNMIFKKLPQEALLEVKRNGIYLTGGGSNLYGLADYLSFALGFEIEKPEESDIACVIGAGKTIEDKALLNKIKLKI